MTEKINFYDFCKYKLGQFRKKKFLADHWRTKAMYQSMENDYVTLIREIEKVPRYKKINMRGLHEDDKGFYDTIIR